MGPEDPIPIEVRAEVECRQFFAALREGDYTAAAAAQQQLRKLGWTLTRETERKTRPRSATAR
jgi:hypothetical protein